MSVPKSSFSLGTVFWKFWLYQRTTPFLSVTSTGKGNASSAVRSGEESFAATASKKRRASFLERNTRSAIKKPTAAVMTSSVAKAAQS